MTTLTAAADSTRSLSLDFSSKLASSSTSDAGGFASKLLDAQQSAKSEPTPAAHPVESKRPVEKAKRSEPAADDKIDATSAKKPVDQPTKKSDDAKPTDPADQAEKSDEKDDEKKPTAAKSSDDALLAALAAAATPAVTKAVAKIDDGKPANDKPAEPSAVAAAAPAANGVIQGNVPVAVDDQPAATTDAKGKAVAAADSKDANPADAKLDPLTAKLKPVDEKNAPLPPEAAEQKGGGSAKQHSSQQQPQQQSSNDPSAAIAQASDAATPSAVKTDAKDASFDDVLAKLAVSDGQTTQSTTPAPAPAPVETPLRPEQQFAKDNIDRVVTSVQTQVSNPSNGTMNVHLEPPDLGALDVAAKMLDGKMSVSFTTSNEQATQLLSHNLSHLKTSLESAGITVDRLEVRQGAATSTNASSDRDSTGQQQQSGKGFESASQQQSEQQRKQMVDKLWRKYAYGSDEVDLVA